MEYCLFGRKFLPGTGPRRICKVKYKAWLKNGNPRDVGVLRHSLSVISQHQSASIRVNQNKSASIRIHQHKWQLLTRPWGPEGWSRNSQIWIIQICALCWSELPFRILLCQFFDSDSWVWSPDSGPYLETMVVNIKCLFVILDIMPTFGLTFKVYEHHTSSNRSAVLCINNIQSCFFCCQNGTYWVPSLAEIWTQKHILDKLAEMRRLLEVKRKTSVSVEHMQVFEYLTPNCLLHLWSVLDS